MYICKFCKFRCVDVDSFVRICRRAVSYRFTAVICTNILCLQPFFFFICAKGQQLNSFISLQYLIYNREKNYKCFIQVGI